MQCFNWNLGPYACLASSATYLPSSLQCPVFVRHYGLEMFVSGKATFLVCVRQDGGGQEEEQGLEEFF